MTEVIIYQGEVAPRSRWIAILLSLVLPGLGHVYVGRPGRGIGVFMVMAATAVFALSLTYLAEFFFIRTLGVLALFYVYTEVWLCADLNQILQRYGDPYVLRSYNHSLVYLSAVLLLVIVPAFTFMSFMSSHLLGSHQVRSEGMFPHLVPGDRVLFQRENATEVPIQRGQLAVVELEGGALSVLRVAGLPGDSVRLLSDGSVVINDGVLRRDRLGEVTWRHQTISASDSAPLVGFLEHSEARVYQVFYSTAVTLAHTPGVRLAHDAFYLLSDNRTTGMSRDSRHMGPIGSAQLLGRPLHVWYSAHPTTDSPRWSRIGLTVH